MKLPKFETLNLSCDARGVLTIALNRPEKRNAFSGQMIADLFEFSQTVSAMDAVRVVVLRGRGRVFCAGGDLEWMKAQIAADRAERMAEAHKLAQMLKRLNTLPKPLIGVLQGGAFGGGVGLAAICDIAIAEDSTKFGLTETRLGLIPATISPYVIARMGEGKARRVFMSAKIFGAAEAKDLDLIADYLPAEAIEARLEAEISPYLQVAPGAVAASKRLARKLGPPIDDAIIEHTISALADVWEGVEAAQGIDAFLTKTPPPWQ